MADTVRQAVREIAKHPLRTSLALAGIVVGVAACVASIAVTDGLRGVHLGFWKRFGGDRGGMLWPADAIYKAGRATLLPKVYPLGPDDVPFLLDAVPELELVSPYLRLSLDLRSKRAAREQTMVRGVGADLLSIRPFQLRSGRFFTAREVEEAARVVVLFGGLADDLFGDLDPVGQELLVGGQRTRVVGVLRTLFENGPQWAFVPVRTGQLRFGVGSEPWLLVFKVRDGADRDAAARGIRAALVRRYPGSTEDNFRVRLLGDFTDAGLKDIKAQGRVFTSVALLCLLAGGVGILNVFLISVTERTREIGLRMALGASRRSVLGQVLLEALLLSSLGGALGVALGQAAARGFRHIVEARGAFAPEELEMLTVAVGVRGVLLAVGMSVATAVVFGSYPAFRASRLDPAECMRHE